MEKTYRGLLNKKNVNIVVSDNPCPESPRIQEDRSTFITWCRDDGSSPYGSPDSNPYPTPMSFMIKMLSIILKLNLFNKQKLLEDVEKMGYDKWLDKIRTEYSIYPVYKIELDGKVTYTVSNNFIYSAPTSYDDKMLWAGFIYSTKSMMHFLQKSDAGYDDVEYDETKSKLFFESQVKDWESYENGECLWVVVEDSTGEKEHHALYGYDNLEEKIKSLGIKDLKEQH